MAPRPSVTRVVLAMLLACLTDAKQRKCPNACECYFSKTNWVTDCSWLEPKMIDIPFESIEMDIHTLNMAGNALFDIKYPFPEQMQPRILNVSNNFIANITAEDFAGLLYLEYVDISNNYGAAINPNSFQGAIGLTTIVSNDNPFDLIDGPILNVSTLLNLYLVNCDLKWLSPQSFAYVTNLNTLDLSANPLKTLQPGILDPLKNLKNLYLNNCSLTYISPDTFNELRHILILELGNNNFENQITWTTALNPLGKLKSLDVRYSSISTLNENIFLNNTMLRRLVLAGNEFADTDIITTLCKNIPNLYVLDLSYCTQGGRVFKTSLADATELRTLYLSGNHFTSEYLGESLLQLNKLVKLSVKDCELTKFPCHYFNHLKYLDISYNKLNLTNSFSIESLEHLDMGYNNLEYLSVAKFSNMSKLKSLVLSGNKLKNLEKGFFKHFKNLKVLELNKCGLEKLNNTIFYEDVPYPNLDELRLSENPIQTLREGSILPFTMTNLHILDMSKCNLTYLTKEYFIPSPNLKKLYLCNNTLFSNQTKYMEHLTKIEYLDVAFNNMTSASPETFKYNNQLVSMNLVGNPWLCDCSIVSMRQWALARNIEIQGYTLPLKEHTWQFLLCDIDFDDSPTNRTEPLSLQRHTFFPREQNIVMTWRNFVKVSYCPKPNENVTKRSSRIVTREVHENRSKILEADNEAHEILSLIMSICVIMLTVSTIVAIVFTTYKKQEIILIDSKYMSCDNPRKDVEQFIVR